MYAPHSMLRYWDLIQPKDDIDDNEIDSMPLLFTSSESYIQSKILFKIAWNFMSVDGIEGLISKKFKYHNYGEGHRFCKAVRVDTENSMEKSYNDKISSTHALITVLFEDVFEAVNILNTLIDQDDALDPWPHVTLMN
jgi:hypothetical protein